MTARPLRGRRGAVDLFGELGSADGFEVLDAETRRFPCACTLREGVELAAIRRSFLRPRQLSQVLPQVAAFHCDHPPRPRAIESF